MRSTSNSRVLSLVAVLALVSIAGVVTASLAAEYVAPRNAIIQPEQLNNLVDRSKKDDRLTDRKRMTDLKSFIRRMAFKGPKVGALTIVRRSACSPLLNRYCVQFKRRQVSKL
jgi:hypothetical protein